IDLFAAGHIDKYRLFRNDNCPGNFLNLNLIGTVSTYNAVGAMVMLWAEGESITRWVHGGEGKHDFSSFNLEFGLGDKTMVDSLIIHWPGGIVEKMYDLVANQFLTITEGSTPLSLIMSPNTMICYGDSVQIYGEVSGGSGNYNFLWSPSTGLSDPTVSNPIAFPDTTTIYTLTVDDGISTISDSILVAVFGNLNPEIMAIPNDTVDINDAITLEVGSGYLAYLWQDGSSDSLFIATNTSGPNGGEQVYWVIVVGSGGCTGSDTISVWFLPLTEINENKPGISFEVYPNPAKDKISISFGEITGDVEIQILTTFGNLLYKSGLKQVRHNYRKDIDISFLSEGVYLINLISSGGKISGIRKFVKMP
ncbi:MAG: ASPIC/UnbV domain-containing protein, partial [Bacteroidales bacterium]|nr:ASPIC/UnbV domain-containing protein [Bacteroidales bacterium]